MTPRPSIARTRELEALLARAEARAEVAERIADRLLASIERMVPKAAPVGALPYVPMADVTPAEAASDEEAKVLTPRVWGLCEELAFGSTRQAGINRRMARKFAQQGMSEAQVMNALRQGEQVTP